MALPSRNRQASPMQVHWLSLYIISGTAIGTLILVAGNLRTVIFLISIVMLVEEGNKCINHYYTKSLFARYFIRKKNKRIKLTDCVSFNEYNNFYYLLVSAHSV